MQSSFLGPAFLASLSAIVSGTVNVPKQMIVPATSEKPAVEMYVMNMGSGIWPGEGENAYDVMMAWFAQGGRSIDSAWLYHDETQIAKAMLDSGLERKDVFITSKIPGCMGAKQAPNYIQQNLKQLNTTYIDLMLIHWPNWPLPSSGPKGDCAGTWQALEDSYSKGELRSIGVSQFKVVDLEKLQKTWKVKPAVNQIQLNVFSHDDDTMKWCKANSIIVEAYSPLTCHWIGKPDSSIFKDPTVTRIAKVHNVSNAQVGLRWIVQRGHVFAVLSGNPAHQGDDAAIFDNGLTLTEDEMKQLDSIQGSNATLV